MSVPDRVVVVGAGISGLAAAHALRSAGVDVLVLEASGRTGGVLHADEVGGVRVDLGAEAMLARRPEGVDLARAVGLGDLLVTPTSARPAVWRADGVRPLPTGTVMGVPGSGTDLSALLRPDELAETARARAARAAGIPAATGAGPSPDGGEDVSVADAVVAEVGRPVLDLLVEPLLGGVYAGRTERLSLAATVPALDAVRRRGEPLSAAADRAAASGPAPGVPVFTGVAGGMARLAGAVAEDLAAGGAEVRLGVRVTGAEQVPGGWRLQTSAGPVDAAAVVLALPTTTTARLLAGPVPAAADALAGVEVAGVAVVALAVDRLRPQTSGLLVPPVEAAAAGVDVKAVTFSGAKWDWVAAQDDGRGAGVLRASVGRAGEAAALRRDDAALADLVRRDLAVLLGEEHRATLAAAPAAVARWGGALPQYAPGHLARVARVRAAVAAVPGLAVTGAFLDGVGVPACVASARSEVRRLLAAGWGA
ncbi:protoporphyrinogen oxidase [Aquipuribacter hungaricus]|uniref:Coproporphyrinogen III oxidase n=2 Tax=Aquipuribacter hungaricus TaxID=545624 RepID=A0ABV7WC90_9MICO